MEEKEIRKGRWGFAGCSIVGNDSERHYMILEIVLLVLNICFIIAIFIVAVMWYATRSKPLTDMMPAPNKDRSICIGFNEDKSCRGRELPENYIADQVDKVCYFVLLMCFCNVYDGIIMIIIRTHSIKVMFLLTTCIRMFCSKFSLLSACIVGHLSVDLNITFGIYFAYCLLYSWQEIFYDCICDMISSLYFYFQFCNFFWKCVQYTQLYSIYYFNLYVPQNRVFLSPIRIHGLGLNNFYSCQYHIFYHCGMYNHLSWGSVLTTIIGTYYTHFVAEYNPWVYNIPKLNIYSILYSILMRETRFSAVTLYFWLI